MRKYKHKKEPATLLHFSAPIFSLLFAWTVFSVIYSDMHKTKPVKLYVELETCIDGDITCILWNDYQRKGGSIN